MQREAGCWNQLFLGDSDRNSKQIAINYSPLVMLASIIVSLPMGTERKPNGEGEMPFADSLQILV